MPDRVIQSESADARVSVGAGIHHDTGEVVTDIIVADRTSSTGEHTHVVIGADSGQTIHEASKSNK